MIVAPDIFQGELAIGQLDYSDVQAELMLFIEKYEPAFLALLLGDKLYQELKSGLQEDPVNAKWEKLRDDVRYMVACYIYYWYQRNKATMTGGVGEVEPETDNAIRASSEDKLTRAWNEMVGLAVRFNRTVDKVTYPSYATCTHSNIYHYINTLGI